MVGPHGGMIGHGPLVHAFNMRMQQGPFPSRARTLRVASAVVAYLLHVICIGAAIMPPPVAIPPPPAAPPPTFAVWAAGACRS